MTKDFDDAAIERVARWLGNRCLEINNSELSVDDFFGKNAKPSFARTCWEQDAREVVALLTNPPDAV